MKKLLAIALAMSMAFSTAAFAGTKGVLEWNEELQAWEITFFDDGEDDTDPWIIPEGPGYQEVEIVKDIMILDE